MRSADVPPGQNKACESPNAVLTSHWTSGGNPHEKLATFLGEFTVNCGMCWCVPCALNETQTKLYTLQSPSLAEPSTARVGWGLGKPKAGS